MGLTLDTTRAGRLGCYGYEGASTPVLDGLAAGGVRFGDAVSCVPGTLPAHASLFTGQDPPSHGVRMNGLHRLDESHPTLAEILGARGYETAAFLSAFVLDPRCGLGGGFDHFDARVTELTRDTVQRSATAVTDAALAWVEGRAVTRPLLPWVHDYDADLRFAPPEPYASECADHPYDGEIAYMDAQIGRLPEGLWRRMDRERTLVLALGDHGESVGGHHEQGHSLGIYDDTQRVPLLLWAPGIDRAPCFVDDVVVTITDLYSTVLDLLGFEAKTEGNGRSLLACRAPGDRAVHLETLRPHLDHRWAPLFGMRRHGDKYILAPRSEYYDLRIDPAERHDLFAGPSLHQVAAIEELAAARGDRLRRDPAVEASSALVPTAEEAIKLKALGYAAGGGDDEGSPLADPKDMLPLMELLHEAHQLRAQGRFDEALALAEEVLRRSP